jgi:hypothetical protein
MSSILERARERLTATLTGQKPVLKSVLDQTDDEKQVVTMVRTFVEEIRSHPVRIANEGIWMTNIAYLLGLDSIHFDTTMRQYRPMGEAQYLSKDRIHVNKILPACQNRLARLLKNPPKFDVRPRSNDQEDKDAAELGLKVILNYWDKECVNDKRIDLKMWCQQAGLGYLKVCWDSAGGKFMVVPGEDGKDTLEFEGDIRIDVCSPFEIFTDLQAKRFDEVRKLTQAKIRPLEYFRLQYKDRGHLVKEEGCWLNSLAYDQSINMSTNSTGGTNSPDKAMKDSAIELSYYEVPSREHPRGRHIITANGVLLKNGPLPASEVSNEPGMIPFAKFDDIRIGGKYTPEAVITHMRPIQDQLNRTLNQRARWVNRLLAGKYIAPRGSGVRSDALNDQSGELVEYTPVPNTVNSGEPHALEIPAIPQSAYIEEERLEEHLDETAGIGEVSKGQLPAAGIPAIGMEFLVEQDDTRIGVMTEGDENSYARVGKLILRFAQAYCNTERILKESGPNTEYVVKKWKGDMIKGNDDVIVIKGSTLPGSKVLKRQEILNMYVRGLLGDPTDPKVRQKVLQQLEYGDTAEAWLDLALDMHQIKLGIEQIENGQKPIVDEQDNHALWIQEINRYRKGDKFARLSEESQILMLQVREEHLSFEVKLRFPETDDSDIPPESTAAQDTFGQELGMGAEMEAANASRAGAVSGTEPQPIPAVE